jgi:hypothetical protein
MSNADLIAEARALIADCATYNFGMRNADKLAHEVAGKLADALESAERAVAFERLRQVDEALEASEAQPAPLVAASKAELVAQMQAESFAYHARFNDGPMPHDEMVDALLASGVVSLATDAKADGWDACQQVAETSCSCHPPKPWDNPFREITEAQWYADRNPYRESEARND